ncbi:hypothetical protein C8R43DRAFT_962588 [Mycena crocata]|nr:hypothetical protein C8R43DRAFT_962588 [Mycena crocata]
MHPICILTGTTGTMGAPILRHCLGLASPQVTQLTLTRRAWAKCGIDDRARGLRVVSAAPRSFRARMGVNVFGRRAEGTSQGLGFGGGGRVSKYIRTTHDFPLAAAANSKAFAGPADRIGARTVHLEFRACCMALGKDIGKQRITVREDHGQSAGGDLAPRALRRTDVRPRPAVYYGLAPGPVLRKLKPSTVTPTDGCVWTSWVAMGTEALWNLRGGWYRGWGALLCEGPGGEAAEDWEVGTRSRTRKEIVRNTF